MMNSIFPLRLHGIARLSLAAALCAGLGPAMAADSRASRYYENALTRYEQRDMPGAIIQLKNALQIDKSMLPVQVLLGRALLANGELLAAEVAFQEALRLGVNRAEVVVPMAQAYLAQGKHRALLDQPLFALAGLPQDVQVQVLLQRAAAASDLGETRMALQTIADAGAMAPRESGVWLAEVPIRVRAQQYAEAEAALARAAALAPRGPQAAELHYQRGALAHVQGNATSAVAAYTQVLAGDAQHVEARIARAGLYLDLQRPADAGRDLAELLKQLPREPRAAYLRAELARRENQPAAVRTALKQVTDLLDPVPMDIVRYRPQLLLLNGMAHFELDEREKAKFYLDALQRVQPGTAAAKLLAQLHLQDGGADRAIPLLEAYLKSRPDDAQALTLLASSHMSQGRSARAIALMQEALRMRDATEHRAALGMGLLRNGQTAVAQTELENAWRRDPAQVQAGVALTGIYLRGGKSAQAVTVAEALAKRAPDNAGYQDLLGMALAQTGKVDAARAAFERASALDPAWIAPQLHLARLDIAKQQFDVAEVRLTTLLKKEDKNVDLLLELAVLAAQRGKTDDQLRWLQKAADHAGREDLRPNLVLVDLHLRHARAPQALEAARTLGVKAGDNLQAALAQARAHLANGDVPGARVVLTGASRVAAYNAAPNVQIATLQMAANHLDGAAYSLEKALSSEPGNLSAQAMSVDLDLRRGDLPKAEQRARQIAQQHPAKAIGHTLQGDAAHARGQTAVAVDAYRRAHQAEPSTDTALQLFGQLWAQDGGRAAARLLEGWLRQRPQDVRARRTLADSYAASGQYAAARSGYDTLLASTPNDAVVLNNQANVLLRLKDPGALAMAERAAAQAPADAHALDTLGWVLFQTGGAAQRDRALQLLRDARLREPGSGDIRYHLAVVLAEAGRLAEAREELAAARKSELTAELHAEAERLATTLR